MASLMSAVSNAIKLVRLAVRGDWAAVLSAVASLTLGSFVSSTYCYDVIATVIQSTQFEKC
jgi:hypothetical protein